MPRSLRTSNSELRTSHAGIIALLLTVLLAPAAHAQHVQDLVRIKGAESNKLVGMGLVVGLKGTGDGGKFLPAMRPLAAAASNLSDTNINPAELKDVKNVAWVMVEAVLPAAGVREGDQVDVRVSAIGAAKSLKDGQLFATALTAPIPNAPVYAMASGPVTIEGPDSPTVGLVKSGAQLIKDVPSNCVKDGHMTLVINNSIASWPMAYALASQVNGVLAPEDGAPVARATDAKNIVVDIPAVERANPASFISEVMLTYVDISQIQTEARVVVNEKTGTIIVTGDVRISPVLISHKGLTITTITPTVEPTPANPKVEQKSFVALDPEKRGGARLADLLAAFNQLKVEAPDRIAILRLIEKSGKLHAQMIVE